ncbi:MAG: DUF6036 family nucleotidyltransferase [Steroidobacteraceae bacterium]
MEFVDWIDSRAIAVCQLILREPRTLRKLQLFALDPVDLALSKLERNSDRDREDVLRLAQAGYIDCGVLKAQSRPNLLHHLIEFGFLFGTREIEAPKRNANSSRTGSGNPMPARECCSSHSIDPSTVSLDRSHTGAMPARRRDAVQTPL